MVVHWHIMIFSNSWPAFFSRISAMWGSIFRTCREHRAGFSYSMISVIESTKSLEKSKASHSLRNRLLQTLIFRSFKMQFQYCVDFQRSNGIVVCINYCSLDYLLSYSFTVTCLCWPCGAMQVFLMIQKRQLSRMLSFNMVMLSKVRIST
jgi:hypothetical protein